MPRSKTLSRGLAISSSSWRRSIAANIGAEWLELGAGVLLCATTQIEQGEFSDLLGWLWVDSATAVHSTKDRQSQASHRTVERMPPCNGLDSLQLITVVWRKAMSGRVLLHC